MCSGRRGGRGIGGTLAEHAAGVDPKSEVRGPSTPGAEPPLRVAVRRRPLCPPRPAHAAGGASLGEVGSGGGHSLRSAAGSREGSFDSGTGLRSRPTSGGVTGSSPLAPGPSRGAAGLADTTRRGSEVRRRASRLGVKCRCGTELRHDFTLLNAAGALARGHNLPQAALAADWLTLLRIRFECTICCSRASLRGPLLRSTGRSLAALGVRIPSADMGEGC